MFVRRQSQNSSHGRKKKKKNKKSEEKARAHDVPQTLYHCGCLQAASAVHITGKKSLTAQYFCFPKPLMNYLGISSSYMENDRLLLSVGCLSACQGAAFGESSPTVTLLHMPEQSHGTAELTAVLPAKQRMTSLPTKATSRSRSFVPELEERSSPAPPPPAFSSLRRAPGTCPVPKPWRNSALICNV